ncbi:hypothetical protein Y1Q_0001936 [Alligator mississippiensis]|uniref:Uncharacterized protein n=1 Tax=Alligator mississippiensis TaxID=8496 RepID=A0A151PGQ5_ALLMI|nr:hypothetical protein Y1Q_0001936 [Alligator mississippiensis]
MEIHLSCISTVELAFLLSDGDWSQSCLWYRYSSSLNPSEERRIFTWHSHGPVLHVTPPLLAQRLLVNRRCKFCIFSL